MAVPLGKSPGAAPRAACILEILDKPDLPDNVVCREICWPLETAPLINAELLDLALDLASRQGLEPGEVLGHILPQGLRSTALKIKWPSRGTLLALAETGTLPQAGRHELAAALLENNAWFVQSSQDEASQEFCQLQVDPPWPVRPAAKKQIAILDYIYQNGLTSRRSILNSLGAACASPLRALVAAGLITLKRSFEEEYPNRLMSPPPAAFDLNQDQRLVLTDLLAALSSPEGQCRLLYGVTGSGKTAVYLELIKACLKSGKSAILLAPEVALAQKLFRDAVSAIPREQIVLYHGYQTPSRREAAFRKLAVNKAPLLIVGTRSALFLPLSQIGCIILDEEHDDSYKQEERLSYHAKELAWLRMREHGALLLLGSATPDIKSFHASQNGKLPMLRLPRRVGKASLPPVELVDIGPNSGLAKAGTQGILARESEKALLACLHNGDQAVILLNRRGYAPMVYCVHCGKTLRCPNCEIGLNFHKSTQKLVCHYCNHSMPFPSPCPVCGTMSYMALGEGTERLTERLEALAGQPALRLDRDNARRPERIEEILNGFARQESPFLVGTQMLSKGHHFPNVTLVIVADGDIGLNLPDYRAAERTFQLLAQAAGRAGRGEKAGHVLIQTHDPGHYFWPYVLNYDYEGFYEEELARRKKMLYPPFTLLALMRISFSMEDREGTRALGLLASTLREKASKLPLRLLGPAPAPIAMLRGQKRFHCLLKCEKWEAARQLYFFAKNFKTAARLKISLDLGPVNML